MMAAKILLSFWARRWSCCGQTAFRVVATVSLSLLLAGCASWQAPPDVDDSALRARAVSATRQDVTLRAAALSARDSQEILGVNVNATGVQPVWVEIDNSTPQMLWLLRAGTDPDYFSPLEVAWSFHSAFSHERNAKLDDHFDRQGFQNPIAPGTTESGIIFVNPHSKTMLLNVDLLGQGQVIPFTVFPPVPDDALDETPIGILTRLAAEAVDDYQEADKFRAALEHMPCCATGRDGTTPGDPLNAVMVGGIADLAAAFARRGFRRDERELDNAQRLFGRPPDVVARKAGQGGAPANWLRLWVAPVRYRGQAVFLAQAGRPVGGRFAAPDGLEPRLHPDVDEARNLLIQDMLYSEGLGALAFAAGVGLATPEQPRESSGGTTYYTDGLRAVLFFVTRPLDLSDVKILDWVPLLQRREAEAAEKK